MATINERIRISLELVSKSFVNPMRLANEKMKNFNGQLKENEKVMKKSAKRTAESGNNISKNTARHVGFGRVMGMNVEQMKSLNENQHLMRNRMGRSALAIRKATHGMRGFRMEMLGVMFFGMAMNRMFLGLANTSLEWFGVMEILSLGLGILFLPLAEKMLTWAISFLKWTTSLTDEQKAFYNKLVLVGIGLGLVLFLFGTLALGIGSLILAFGFLFSPLGMVITALTALGGFIFLKNMFGDMSTAVADTEQKLIAFGVSGEILDLIKEKVVGLKDSLLEMSRDWILVGTQIATDIVTGIGNFLKDNPLMIAGAIAGMFLGGPVGALIGGAIGKLFQNIKYEELEGLLDGGAKMMTTLLDGMVANADKIAEALEMILIKIGEWIGENIPALIELGFKIGLAILKGIGKGILSGLGALLSMIPGFGKGDTFRTAVESIGPQQNDFIWRPGQGVTPINPNDTLVGFKGAPPNLGSGGGLNVTNNFYGFTMSELERELDSRDRDMVSQMERNR